MIRRMFGKRGAGAQADRDRFALDLLTRDWQCACCGEWHHGIMDLAASAPDPWPHVRDHEPNSALRRDGDFLSQDFCVLGGEDFFVRAVMEIPVRGLDRTWGWGCWTSLSRANFDFYVERFDKGIAAGTDPWFGWLANACASIRKIRRRSPSTSCPGRTGSARGYSCRTRTIPSPAPSAKGFPRTTCWCSFAPTATALPRTSRPLWPFSCGEPSVSGRWTRHPAHHSLVVAAILKETSR